MINKPLHFKGLNIRIPIIMSTKGRGFISHGSGLMGLLGGGGGTFGRCNYNCEPSSVGSGLPSPKGLGFRGLGFWS